MDGDEDWRTFSAHLDQALELDHERRQVWLAALTQQNPALAERLRGVLAAQQQMGFANFLAGPSPIPVSEVTAGTLIGRAVGPYVIDAEIGRGGMGSVWRAHRADGRFAGDAAIKFVHAAWIGNSGDQRFRTEGTLLASLDHPHIARLIDAGVLEGAQPYLILEYVEGEPIDAYCEVRSLGVEERLRLFLGVLAAVSHAHSHLIVHRDLKPSNVLVTRDGKVKLLDFGIAKLLDAGTGVGAPTQSRASALTPQYAAPEQLLGRPVTTATDVYALGMLLYLLLTGRHPFSSDVRSQAELLSMVLTKEPPRASAVGHVGAIPKKNLRGDLDNILHKALKKDPGERYSSARALGEDLQRHLAHQPVRARADTLGYRTRKFVRRNRLSTSLATLAIIALLAGLVTAMCQSRAAQAVAAHAEIERGKATATRDFLISVFQASDPRIAQDKPRGQVTARELLDNSAQHIHTTFSNHPDTELELLGLTASIYRELGEEDRFRSLRDQQVELAHRLYGDLHPIVIEKLMEDAHAASDAGDDKSAKALLAQADVFIRRAGLDRSALRARWWYELSESLWTEPPPRTALVEAIHKSVDLYAAVAPQDPGYVSALNTLGNEHSSRFDDVEAVKIYRRAIAVAGASPNRDEAELQSLISNLAESLLYSGDFDGAETMNKASIELARRTNGEDHVRYWRSMAEYAYEVHLRGDRDRALDMFKTLINSFPAAMTPLQSKNAADVEDLYARCLTADGSAREAIPILESLERIFGVSSPFEFDLRVTQGVLGEAYALAGRSADAKRELRASLDGWEAKSERDSYPLLNSREKWGRFLLAQGDLEGAEGQFREILLQSHSRNFMPTVRAQIGEVQIAIAHQNIEAALEKSHIALDMLDDMKGVRDMRLWPEAWVARSEALRLSRDLAGARQWALRALEASRKYDAPGAVSIAKAKDALQRAGGVPQA